MSRSKMVFQSVDPKAMASKRAANHLLTQRVCEERYIALLSHLSDDYVKPTPVQKHRMNENRKRNLAAAQRKVNA